MWTRKDIKEFKETVRKEKDAVIKIGSGETVTVRTAVKGDQEPVVVMAMLAFRYGCRLTKMVVVYSGSSPLTTMTSALVCTSSGAKPSRTPSLFMSVIQAKKTKMATTVSIVRDVREGLRS